MSRFAKPLSSATGIGPSDLTFLWSECQRCFWLRYNKGLRRPFTMPGIISNLTTMQGQSYATARSSDFSADLPSGVVHSTGE